MESFEKVPISTNEYYFDKRYIKVTVFFAFPEELWEVKYAGVFLVFSLFPKKTGNYFPF